MQNGKAVTSKKRTPKLYKTAVRPTACVSGEWGESANETEKSNSFESGFFAGAYPLVRCTLC
jgi:hypothetical protein